MDAPFPDARVRQHETTDLLMCATRLVPCIQPGARNAGERPCDRVGLAAEKTMECILGTPEGGENWFLLAVTQPRY